MVLDFALCCPHQDEEEHFGVKIANTHKKPKRLKIHNYFMELGFRGTASDDDSDDFVPMNAVEEEEMVECDAPEEFNEREFVVCDTLSEEDISE